jgi:hypothetical protein
VGRVGEGKGEQAAGKQQARARSGRGGRHVGSPFERPRRTGEADYVFRRKGPSGR